MRHSYWVIIVGGLATYIAYRHSKIFAYVIGGATVVAAYIMFRKGA